MLFAKLSVGLENKAWIFISIIFVVLISIPMAIVAPSISLFFTLPCVFVLTHNKVIVFIVVCDQAKAKSKPKAMLAIFLPLGNGNVKSFNVENKSFRPSGI